VVFLLRPLQQLFQRKEYPAYTDTKFAWEDDDNDGDDKGSSQTDVSPIETGSIGGHANAGSTGSSNGEDENVPLQGLNAAGKTEYHDNGGNANAVTEKASAGIPPKKAGDADIDSSDDEHSL